MSHDTDKLIRQLSLVAFLMQAARVSQSAFLWITPVVAISSLGLTRSARRAEDQRGAFSVSSVASV